MAEEQATTANNSGKLDALWERVDNQGRAIRGLAEETATQFRDFRADTSKSISELASSVKGVADKLDLNARSFAEGQRPQYLNLFGAMVAAAGLAIGFVQWQQALRDRPFDDRITALRSDVTSIAAAYKPRADIDAQTNATNAQITALTGAITELAKATVTKETFTQTLAFQKEIGDLKEAQLAVRRKTYEDQISRLEARMDRSDAREEKFVSRQEHEYHWSQEDKDRRAMAQRVEELDHRIDGLSPSSAETTRRVLDRIHELEQQIYRKSGAQ